MSPLHHRLLTAALLAVSLPALGLAPAPVAAASQPPGRCQIERMVLPGRSTASGVVAGDQSGRWLAGFSTHDQATHLIVWDRGVPTEPDLDFGYAVPGGISSAGVVAASATTAKGQRGIAYVNGTLVRLASPPHGPLVTVTGISNQGLISGWSMDLSGSHQRAYVWSLDDPQHPTRLRVPPGSANSFGTSADGHTVVSVFAATQRAFVFAKSGRRTELHGTAAGFDVKAAAIADGWVVGSEHNFDTDEAHFVRWDLRTMRPEIISADFYYLNAINSRGVVGGPILRDPPPERAAMYSDHITWLPPLEEGGQAEPRTISRAGHAAGTAEIMGKQAAVRWTCASPPVRPAASG